MEATRVYQIRAERERVFVALYDYAVDLENRLGQLAGNFQKAFEQLQAANIKLQQYEEAGKEMKDKK